MCNVKKHRKSWVTFAYLLYVVTKTALVGASRKAGPTAAGNIMAAGVPLDASSLTSKQLFVFSTFLPLLLRDTEATYGWTLS
jgi:hypothetical protein